MSFIICDNVVKNNVYDNNLVVIINFLYFRENYILNFVLKGEKLSIFKVIFK